MSVSPQELAATLLRRASARREADAKDQDECLREVARTIATLRGELGFGRAWLIGSLAWGGFGVRSDVDIVVEKADTPVANALADAIGDATGRNVDVLVLGSLPPGFQKRVLEEGRHVP